MYKNLICKYIIFASLILLFLKYIPNIKLNNKDIFVLTFLLMLIIIYYDINYNKKCIIREKMTELTTENILNATSENQNIILKTYNKEQKNNLIKDLNLDKLNELFFNLDNNNLNYIIMDLELKNKDILISNLNNDNLNKLIIILNNDNINYLFKNLSRDNKKKLLFLLNDKNNEFDILINKFNSDNINDIIIELYDVYLIKFISNKNNINKIILTTKLDTNNFIINNLSNENIILLISNLETNNINKLFNNLSDDIIEKIMNNLNDNMLNNLFNNFSDELLLKFNNNSKLNDIIKKLSNDILNKITNLNKLNNLNDILTYLHGNINYDNINKYVELINIAIYNPIYSKAIVDRAKNDKEFNILIKLIESDKNKVLELSKNNKLKILINEIMNENENKIDETINNEEVRTKKYIDTLIGKNKYFDNNGLVKNVLESDMKYSNLTLEQMEKLGEYDNTFSNNWQNDYILLNTDKWRPPVGNQYKCKTEKTCPVCPSLTHGYPVNVREFNNVKKILPPDNISVDYINDKLNK